MSAYFPASIVPTSCVRPIKSAALDVAARINSRIGSERHLHASLERLLKILTLQAPDSAFFIEPFFIQPELSGLLQNVIVVINIHHEIRSMLLGEPNILIIRQAGMFNGINSRKDCVFDPFRTMSMCCNLPPTHVRRLGGNSQLFKRVLRSSRLVSV